MVGLNGLGDRFPHQLSGGQQQRVALARALAIDPELLLLDEPFSGLDPTLRAAVREEVRRILTETKKTTILVTHDQEEALATADQLALLRRGRVTQFGSPHALYADPVDLDTARFLGDANLVRGTLESGAVTTPLGQLRLRPGPAPRDGPVLALVRPEQIAISATAPGACSAQVVRTEFYGHDSLVELQAASDALPEVIRVRVQGPARFPLRSWVGLSASGQTPAWPLSADLTASAPALAPAALRGPGPIAPS